jgi:TonB family protein
MAGLHILPPLQVLSAESACFPKAASHPLKIWGWMLALSIGVHLIFWVCISRIRIEMPPLAAIEPISVTMEPIQVPPAEIKPAEALHPETPPPPVPPKTAKAISKPLITKGKQARISEKNLPIPRSPAAAGNILEKTEPAASTEIPSDAFAVGDGENYAGGTTSSSGQNEQPVLNPPEVKSSEPIETDASPYGSQEAYLNMVRAAIEKSKRYPAIAITRQIEGRVRVRFVLDTDGRVHDVTVVEKCRYDMLDQAAIEAVRSAAPFPKPPASLFKKAIPLDLMIAFELI